MSDILGSLGKPIGSLPVGHTVPTDGFDQGEHGAGVGVSGGHVPSATNQAKGYGQGDSHSSGFNSGVGGEHASGGLSGSKGTPIADKFMGSHESHSHSHSHSSSGEAVSGAYSGGAARDALTGESNAHTTGAGVGPLAENLPGSHQTSGHHHHSSGHHTSGHSSSTGGAYDGSINRDSNSSAGHAHGSSARDAALTGTAGAAAATALGAGATGHHSHGVQSGTGVGVGAVGGSGGHYSTSSSHQTSGQNYNAGTGTGAGVLAGQQAGARGTHGDSGMTGSSHSHGAGAGAAGVGAGAGAAASKHHDSSKELPGNNRGEPVTNPKDLDSGSRHGLVFDKATGKYTHRHDLEEGKR